MPICVECKRETPRDEMYGVVPDLRCAGCAGKRRTVYAPSPRPIIRMDGTVTRLLLVVAALLYLAKFVPLSRLFPEAEGTVFEYLAAFPPMIWNGQIWRLVTSCFLHGGFIHLLFNGMAMWNLGPVLEGHMGRARYLGFVLLIGGASIATEVAVQAATTIGLSGIVFGMFGYLYALRRKRDFAAAMLSPQVIQSFVFMFLLCILLSASGTLPVGNWAHGSGLALGWLFGFGVLHRQQAVMIALAILMSLSLWSMAIYMPWNADFCIFRAAQSLEQGDAEGYQAWMLRSRQAVVPAKWFDPAEAP
jgi:membrane associated rhomboid family serine protease